jgi:hypothetical protein
MIGGASVAVGADEEPGGNAASLEFSFGLSVAGARDAMGRWRPPRITVIWDVSGTTGATRGVARGGVSLGGRAASFPGGLGGCVGDGEAIGD